MKATLLALPAIALFLGVIVFNPTPASAITPIQPIAQYGQPGGWDAPPAELNEMQRRGFHEGVEGARRDFENHRPPNVENREEYRTANFPPEMREAWREGFRRGYNIAVAHLYPQPGMQPEPMMQPGPPPGQFHGWEGNMPAFNEVQRRGYEEGRIGAQRDAENHRRPDPNNRDEYRAPNVPPQLVEEYREGFRRGYEEMVYQMMGVRDEGPWDAAPGVFNEVERRGFMDGMEGARKDMGNHRRPDPNNRDEYRNPHVPPELVEDYRQGFRRGYERAVAHLYGEQR